MNHLTASRAEEIGDALGDEDATERDVATASNQILQFVGRLLATEERDGLVDNKCGWTCMLLESAPDYAFELDKNRSALLAQARGPG